MFNISETSMLSALKKLNFYKASGPDGIPNWLMREYAGILVPSIIYNLTRTKVQSPLKSF